MKRGITLLLLCGVLAACSTGPTPPQARLSAGDKWFCQSITSRDATRDVVPYLRQRLRDLQKDNHWASTGAAIVFSVEALMPVISGLDPQNIQDAELKKLAGDASTSLSALEPPVGTTDLTVDSSAVDNAVTAMNTLAHACGEPS